MRIVPRVTKTDANRTAKPLDRQARSLFWRVPPKECTDDRKIADGIEPKWCSNSDPGDHHAAQRRTDGPADIDADTVCRHRGAEILPGDELRDDGLPDRSRQRGPTPMRNVNSKRLPGVAAPIQTIAANIAATVV